jgi:NTP pyrophosphatase (non-canonical NTP hydrolase)
MLMQLDDYQRAARRTAIYADQHRVIYPALGLASARRSGATTGGRPWEPAAGEVAGKIKKVLRDQGGDFASAPLEAIKDELGDVLWYVAVLAGDLGLSLDEIAAANLSKLASRKERDRLSGGGDRR